LKQSITPLKDKTLPTHQFTVIWSVFINLSCFAS